MRPSAEPERERALGACRELTGAVYGGLDLSAEFRAVQAQGLGETATGTRGHAEHARFVGEPAARQPAESRRARR